MPTGFRNAAGVDLEQLFAPGAGPTAPFLRTPLGVALQFAPLSAGSKGPDVGYRTSAGVDVSNLWAAAGTVDLRLPFDGQTLSAGVTAGSGETGSISAVATFTMLASGAYEGRAFQRGTNILRFSGSWVPAGSVVADFEVRFVISASSGSAPAASNGAPSYVAVSAPRQSSRTATVNAATTDTVNGSHTLTVQLRRIADGQVYEGVVSVLVAATGQV